MSNIFPEEVYHCPYLDNAVNETFKNKIRSYTEIMLAVSKCCVDAQVFCTRVNGKMSCLFLCQSHLLITITIEGKLNCISAGEKDIVFQALQNRFCRGCVRHYCQKLCNVYKFKSF